MGDRVPYVMIAGVKGARNYENAEDPLEILAKVIIYFNYIKTNKI